MHVPRQLGRADALATAHRHGRAHKPAHTLLLSRKSVTVAWVVLALGAVHPPHGLGLPICLFHATTSLPCWGCGLSRSVSCTLHGMPHEAWVYHPFGPLVAMIMVGIALTSILPAHLRSWVADVLDRHARVTVRCYALFVVLFITYGTGRALITMT